MITFYFGVHTNERNSNGEPINKFEEVFELNTAFKYGLIILRGVVLNFKRMIGLKEEYNLEKENK